MVGVSTPTDRQAPRMVVPAGTLTGTPSTVRPTTAGASTGGAVGVRVARAGGFSTMSVAGSAAGSGRRSNRNSVIAARAASQGHQPWLAQRRLDCRGRRLAEPADRGVAHDLADLAQETQLGIARAN